MFEVLGRMLRVNFKTAILGGLIWLGYGVWTHNGLAISIIAFCVGLPILNWFWSLGKVAAPTDDWSQRNAIMSIDYEGHNRS